MFWGWALVLAISLLHLVTPLEAAILFKSFACLGTSENCLCSFGPVPNVSPFWPRHTKMKTHLRVHLLVKAKSLSLRFNRCSLLDAYISHALQGIKCLVQPVYLDTLYILKELKIDLWSTVPFFSAPIAYSCTPLDQLWALQGCDGSWARGGGGAVYVLLCSWY